MVVTLKEKNPGFAYEIKIISKVTLLHLKNITVHEELRESRLAGQRASGIQLSPHPPILGLQTLCHHI